MLDVLDIALQRAEEGKKGDTEEGDPFSVIPLRNSKKCARETTELYLGKRNIDNLINFQYFKNLEVLWLNNNSIVRLEGLDSNFR